MLTSQSLATATEVSGMTQNGRYVNYHDVILSFPLLESENAGQMLLTDLQDLKPLLASQRKAITPPSRTYPALGQAIDR